MRTFCIVETSLPGGGFEILKRVGNWEEAELTFCDYVHRRLSDMTIGISVLELWEEYNPSYIVKRTVTIRKQPL